MKRAGLTERVMPVFRLAAVAVGAAAAVAIAGFATAPVIEDRTAREESSLLRAVAGGRAPGRRYVAFPLSLTRARFEETILSRCPGEAERSEILGYYEGGPGDTLNLKRGASKSDFTSLSLRLESIGYESGGAVRAYRPVVIAGSPAGFVLELQAGGFGESYEILASVGPDGTIRNAMRREREPHGSWVIRRMREHEVRLLRLFIGTKGRGVPTAAERLPPPGADAVSGATFTFAGMGTALREGSLFVMRLGGNP